MLPRQSLPSTLYRDRSVQIDDERWSWPDAELTAERECPIPWLVLPRRGLYTKFVRGRELVAERVTALFYEPGETYRYVHHTRAGACTYVQLDPALWRGALGLAAGEPVRFAQASVPRDAALDLAHFELLRALRAGTPLEPLQVQESVVRYVSALLASSDAPVRTAKTPGTEADHRALVNDALVLLGMRLGEHLTLHDVARELRSSPFHLARLFRQHVGRGMHAHRTSVRLRVALERLSDSPDELTSIALGLGFASASHFSATCRRHFGAPPSVLRRRLTRRGVSPGDLTPGAPIDT